MTDNVTLVIVSELLRLGLCTTQDMNILLQHRYHLVRNPKKADERLTWKQLPNPS